MLNFRNTNIVFIILLLVLIAIQYNHGVDISWFIALLLLYSLFLFYGSFNVRSRFFIKTRYGRKTNEKQIALTFDDGPVQNFTPGILDILKEQNVSATFFCIGKNIDAGKEILHRVHNEGHLIGNHSYSHGFWFDMLPAAKMKAELQQTHDLIRQVIGVDMAWFRPPYGVTNPNLAKAVKAMGYDTIGWNIRSMDTVVKEGDDLLQKIKKRLKPGAVILFHDTSPATVAMLPAFLQFVKEQQYQVVPLDKLLDLQAYR